MKFEGIFLGLESATFEAEGKQIPYYRVHAWVPGTMKYKKLKVSGNLLEQGIKELKFGDRFTCEVEEGATEKGMSFLKIINW
jgi:hypothetical protein